MRFFLALIFLILISVHSDAQNTFLAVNNGGWRASGTWSIDGATPIVCAPCVEGTHYPGQQDDAYTQGFSISIAPGGIYSVNNLWLVSSVSNQLQRPPGGPGGASTLRIYGQLTAYNPLDFEYALPTTTLIRNDHNNLVLEFLGVGEVINPLGWSHASPLCNTIFNAPGASDLQSIGDVSIAQNRTLTVQNGVLEVNGNLRRAVATGTASIVINSGTTLRVTESGNINGGTNTTRFPSIIINGTLTSNSGTTSYINANNLTINAGGTLNVGFYGSDQLQGWWYQNTTPGVLTLDPNSTVVYSSDQPQNIYATTYGNLSLSSTSAVTKTLVGSGLTILGNLTIGNNVTFSPPSQVLFIGTVANQSISGGGVLNFDGGIEVNKTTGTVTVNKNLSSSGPNTITSGTLNLGTATVTLNNATVTNNATITTANGGSLVTNGTSSFTGSGSTTLHNLTIASGATDFAKSFSITGNLVNNGSLTIDANETVTFSGGSSHAISGNAFSVGNMVVNKTASILSNNGTVNLTGLLTMINGNFDADGSTDTGNFILNSDENGDAAIGPITAGSITGEVVFERFYDDTGVNRWRNFGFPVTDVTYAELGASITLAPNSLAVYTESVPGNVDQGWSYVNGGTLNSLQGHTAWMYSTAPATISLRGPLLRNSSGAHDYEITYNNDPAQPASEDGWNFVPNPYASPISWSNPGWIKTNLVSYIAVWDNFAGQYRYTSGGPNSLWNGIIAQGQAFWVQSTASGAALASNESVKVTDPNPVFYRMSAEEFDSRLVVGLKSGIKEDKALIMFSADATPEFDGQFDAYKLKNAIFNLSTLSNEGSNLAVNTLPKSGCTSSIKVNITNAEPGSYTLNFEGLETFKNVNQIILVDRYLDKSVALESGKEYLFDISQDEKSYGSERFVLEFDFKDLPALPEIVSNDNQLISSSDKGNQWYFNNEIVEGATGKYFTPSAPGTYHVVVSDGVCNLQSASLYVSEGYSRVYPNPASEVMKVDVRNALESNQRQGEITIHSLQGQLMHSEAFTSRDRVKEILVNQFAAGMYVLTITNENGAVIEKTKVIRK
jgi:hypothetical protein